ncbi:GerAB/ArcD/ProY family transporter [Bacillus sp. mrc49]|uniref:GerAB/ArcD/ProY family transporter n=1 Tax=Bacillus sp. mrc49 TaxID=2054913 RepID=UPI0012FD452A|nr:GerAB/ArcD/ProY family transporter [Bacillus sp. mrc49]
MTNVNLKSGHTYILAIISTGFMLHVLALPNIITAAGRDAWVSVLFTSIPITIIGFMIFYMCRSLKQQSLLSFLKANYPAYLVKCFAVCLGLVMFSEAFVAMKYTLFWAKDNYASEVPNYIIVISFLLISYYASFKGMKTIAILGPFFFFIVCLLGVFIGISNIPKKDYTLLLPIFEQGYEPSLKGTIYVLAAFGEILYLALLQGYSKQSLTGKGLTLTILFLLMLTLGPLTAAIAEFGPIEAGLMNNPAYEEWKLLTIGKYITRVDFFSIFQWFAGALIRVSLLMFLTNELLGFVKKKWSLSIIYIVLVIGALVNWQSDKFVSFLYQIYYPAVCVVLLSFLFMTFLLVKLKSR